MCALKVFYEPEQLTSQPPSQGGNMGAAGRFIVLLSWWFLAAVSPGTVLSNSVRPHGGNPMLLQKTTKTKARQECLGSFALGDLRDSPSF